MPDVLELSIDTASTMASIALSREGRLVAELTWDCGRDHSRQLLPAIDRLLARQGASKEALRAVFVCIGPGSYAGVRTGVATAKGLAFAMEMPLAGVGRLEIEAYAFAATGLPVVAVHRAGRGEIAWAAYQGGTRNPSTELRASPSTELRAGMEQGTRPRPAPAEPWLELSPPRLAPAEALARELPAGALVTGELDEALAAELVQRGHRIVGGAAGVRRAALLAELGWARLQAGRTDDPKSLEPLYLREPAIGPHNA